jgi:hypothetical protein
MFKDANNNDKWDKGEEPIKEASILINGKYLSSDEKGKTSLRNIEKGNYIVDFSPISNQKGWMPLTILSDTVNLKRDREILIPFKTTLSIVGKVEFSAGAYSIRGNMKLSGLRIVAVSETMKEFEAITNEDGEFFFNLVQGSYTIKMPESILGDKFKFDYLSQDVLVYDQPQESLLFILKEKGRKLNIRRN